MAKHRALSIGDKVIVNFPFGERTLRLEEIRKHGNAEYLIGWNIFDAWDTQDYYVSQYDDWALVE